MALGRKAFATACLKLPGVTLHEQWEALVAKVGDKVFALRGETGGGIVFKVPPLGFAGLTSLEGIGQAPYFAKGQWVSVTPGADITDRDIRAYIAQSHRLVAQKLTRKARAELGLD